MGAYINPPNHGKEQWLNTNGVKLSNPSTDLLKSKITDEKVPVCLVDNGPFSAAGIAFSEAEVDAFTSPTDFRPKQWYVVDRKVARKVSNLSDYEDA